MGLSALVPAVAKEAVVLRTISSPTESKVMLDSDDDGKADMYITIPRGGSRAEYYEMIKDCFEKGFQVEIDDDWILSDGSMSFSYLGGLLSIGGYNILNLFRDSTLFEAAAERSRVQQRQNQGRGYR